VIAATEERAILDCLTRLARVAHIHIKVQQQILKELNQAVRVEPLMKLLDEAVELLKQHKENPP
jgi:hypothetical protein